MNGILEKSAESVSGIVTAMRDTPLVLALVLMNLALLVFHWYYASRVQDRIEKTAGQFFQNQVTQNQQWGLVLKDQNALAEKMMHCILPEDAGKLLQIPFRAPQYAPPAPERPQ
jgi:hypothetical protein